jgi:hypothetical protein
VRRYGYTYLNSVEDSTMHRRTRNAMKKRCCYR